MSSTEPLLPNGTPYTATLTFDPSTLVSSADPIGGTRYSSGSLSFRAGSVVLSWTVSISIDTTRALLHVIRVDGLGSVGTFNANLRINLILAELLTSEAFPVPFPTLPDFSFTQFLINTSTTHSATITLFEPVVTLGVITCTAVAVPPIVRSEGIAELVGDIILTCTNTPPPSGGMPVSHLVTNVNVSLNVNVTNNLQGHPDAVLIINENNCTAPVTVGGSGIGVLASTPSCATASIRLRPGRRADHQ